MAATRTIHIAAPAKAPTGIAGFDEITGGGLPHARTTLVVGGPGSGKTIFALQFLAHGAQACREPGILVAFEESSKRILANAESFGWSLDKLRQRKKLVFMDAQPMPDLIQSGEFDIGGLLASLEAQIRNTGARRIVFDALDVILSLLPDASAQRREIYRLHDWLLAHKLTGVITAKAGADDSIAAIQQPFGFMQFMVDCAVLLNHSVVLGVSQRNLRVQKYRGSSFDENVSAFLIGKTGMEVAVVHTRRHVDARITSERVSSGVERLDTMLGGGVYRGSSVLITGFAGTAKTTLSGAFAEAACRRGERTMFVSFDTDCSEVVRNLSSVGIGLARYVKNGCLRMFSARDIAGSGESYLMRIKGLAKEHGARFVAIDPISAWTKSGNDLTAQGVADRLINWSKGQGTTLLCTSLLDEMSSGPEGGSPLQISALADTWIHLNYLVQAGERNRGLSIVKSRGTAHSNQVRELILSDAGVTLADTYTAGGEVLMGTMRWEKERAEGVTHEAAEAAASQKRVMLDAQEAELEVRVKSLQVELEAKRVEKALLARTTQVQKVDLSLGRTQMRDLRGADAAPPNPK